jgi:hypothetical protein
MNDVTRILSAIEPGDPQAAAQLLHDELRQPAAQRLAREKPGRTPPATARLQKKFPPGRTTFARFTPLS